MSAGFKRVELAPGLYFVATPIGNARDITLRALDVLASADVLAAEDTRSLRRLMDIHGVPLNGRRLVSYHDHNGPKVRPELLEHLSQGRSVAYASEAGMPLVADPGYVLGRAASEKGHIVTCAPGASAALDALAVSGLPSDCFVFAGFPPSTGNARKAFLERFADSPGTLILFESPKRLARLLKDAVEVMGGDRPAAMCRELTKKFEEVQRGSLAELAETLSARDLKGEIVLCIGKGQREVSEADIEHALRTALEDFSLKEAAALVAEKYALPKRDVYQLGLALKRD